MNMSSLSPVRAERNYDTTPNSYNLSPLYNLTENPPVVSSIQLGYSLPHLVVTVFIVVIIILIICGGNLLVVIAIYSDRHLKTKQNWFIASLAVADFLLGLVIMPFSLANEVMGYWYFGSVWCDLWKAIDVLLCTASILSICLISLDRYWSITKALTYPTQRTSTRAALMIAAVWILSAIVCVPPLIGWKNPLPVMDYPLCLLSTDLGYIVCSSMGSFYIPGVIMVFVYYKVYCAAKDRGRKRDISKGESQNENGNKDLLNKTNDKNQKVHTTSLTDDESTWPMYQKRSDDQEEEKGQLLDKGAEGNRMNNVTEDKNDMESTFSSTKTTEKNCSSSLTNPSCTSGMKRDQSSVNLSVKDVEKQKRKIAKARERRATLVLGIVMAVFILCWFPFFTLYIIKFMCLCIPDTVFNVFFWAGYCNSALNPIIYTVFNRDFRHAFQRILCRKRYRR